VLPPIGVNIAAKSTIASKIPFFVRDRFRSGHTIDYEIISTGCTALLNWIRPLSRYGHGGHAAAARQISAIPPSGNPALHPDLQTARLKGVTTARFPKAVPEQNGRKHNGAAFTP
jgi:hypothetical protein